MWEATVRVTREQEVDADLERVWALAATPAALAAMPGQRFAFAVPVAVPGTDRLSCMIVSGKHDVHCAVVDVREEVPGQRITWQVRSAPSRKETLTLSVRPRAGGCTLTAAVSETVPRIDKGSYQGYWRRTVTEWANRLRAIAEGQSPWPPDRMSAEMRDACAGFELPKKIGEASASAVINASADSVWETVWSPDSSRLIDPETVVWAGTVPGTPERAVGELQCTVHHHDDGRITASVYLVKELADGRRAVTQRIGHPDTEMVWLLTPVAEGTRLELTARWPAPTVRKTHATAATDTVATHLQETADAYKEHIEKAAGTPSRHA